MDAAIDFQALVEELVVKTEECFGCGHNLMCVFSEQRKFCYACGAFKGEIERDEVYAARQVFQDD